jgi:hypothetical protein
MSSPDTISPIDPLVPSKAVEEILGIGRRTIGRRIVSDPDFPSPDVRHLDRLYRRRSRIEKYKQLLIRRGCAASEAARRARSARRAKTALPNGRAKAGAL